MDERELPERFAPVLRCLAGATASEEVADSMALEDEITATWRLAELGRQSGDS